MISMMNAHHFQFEEMNQEDVDDVDLLNVCSMVEKHRLVVAIRDVWEK